jgi:transglutaminase-like putative cysteine protease
MSAPTMTPPPAPPSQSGPPPPPTTGNELTSQQWSMTVTPVVAAVTTLCASLALAGVIDGLRWWGYAGVAVTVITAVGLGLRAVRTPILVVGLAQMFALLCLLVALFTDEGIFGLFPGPAALGELGDVLRTSIEVVRTGVPPVEATPAVLCLVVIAIGLVAVLVDTLAVSAGTPAACGLVLLCVYAVPASLADQMLPWWAFVLGAVSFAALLAVDGAHRHQQWRNRPVVQGTSGGVGSPAALVSGAVAIALFAGASVTFIGTVGQLPGGQGGTGQGGLGLNPFTQLRGMLDQDGNVELFRIRNLGNQNRYLRALTLADYDSTGGWRGANRLPDGVAADRPLPPPEGQDNFGPARETIEIDIEPVNSRDKWAPVYGTPRQLHDLPEGMRYDRVGGMIYGEDEQTLPRYVEEADLSEPTTEKLRNARPTSPGDLDPRYLENDNINPQVRQLANELTAGRGSTYDKVRAILDHFKGNGFVYDTETAAGSDADALTDFLFRSKAGFCEQYASSMAILLRAAGIPSRVAMGYTAGFESGDYRSITTKNAHAWVEVYFPGLGWMTFDPTPLSDGTTYTPPYVSERGPSGPQDDPTTDGRTSSAPAAPSTAPGNKEDQLNQQAGAGSPDEQRDGSPSWPWVVVALLAAASAVATGFAVAGRQRRLTVPLAAGAWFVTVVFAAAIMSWWLAFLAVVLVVAGAPGVVRERRRLYRRHEVHTNGPNAATSAWAELLAESTDRGSEAADTETVRVTARRLATEHELDDTGKQALRTVVTEVERSWYGGSPAPDPGLGPAFDTLIQGLRRTDPLGWREKLLPRSVLRRIRRGGRGQ